MSIAMRAVSLAALCTSSAALTFQVTVLEPWHQTISDDIRELRQLVDAQRMHGHSAAAAAALPHHLQPALLAATAAPAPAASAHSASAAAHNSGHQASGNSSSSSRRELVGTMVTN